MHSCLSYVTKYDFSISTWRVCFLNERINLLHYFEFYGYKIIIIGSLFSVHVRHYNNCVNYLSKQNTLILICWYYVIDNSLLLINMFLFIVHWLSICNINYIFFCRPDYISRMDDLAFDMYQVCIFFNAFCANWLDFGANYKYIVMWVLCQSKLWTWPCLIYNAWYLLQDPETAALIRKLDDRKREAVQRKQLSPCGCFLNKGGDLVNSLNIQ